MVDYSLMSRIHGLGKASGKLRPGPAGRNQSDRRGNPGKMYFVHCHRRVFSGGQGCHRCP